MMRKILSVLLVVTVMAVGACSGKPPKPTTAAAGSQVPAAGAMVNGAGANGATGAAGVVGAGSGEDVAGPQEGILAQRIIYFAFDSSDISNDSVALVAAHAHYLVAHPNLHVRLEGNTDERGSREYNIGLGERRAQAPAGCRRGAAEHGQLRRRASAGGWPR